MLTWRVFAETVINIHVKIFAGILYKFVGAYEID